MWQNVIEALKAFFFGVVQGVTEWLPISSTGHLIILNQFLNLNVSDEFWNMFKVVIQFGSIFAVIILYWNKLWPFGKKDNKYPVKEEGALSYFKKDTFSMWFKILVACIPAALAIPFEDKIDKYLSNYMTVAVSLIVFGIAFIIIEILHKNKTAKINSIADIKYSTAFIIGIFQLIAAVFPGTSRSGATIIGALILGLSRKTSAEFSFFLAVPAMLGASLINIIKFGFNYTPMEIMVLLIGMITAFIVSVFVIKFLMSYIKKHDFKIFGYYRIVLGVIVILVFSL